MKSELSKFKQELFKNGIIDYTTSTSGSFVWLPYGVEIRNLFLEQTRKVFSKFSYKEYSFPTIAAGKDFQNITSDIFDFSKGVFWLNDNKLLRPSGEAVIYPQFKRWIKSYKDLPIRVFQIGSSYRKGTPRGIFRSNEAEPFIEGHTAHGSRKESEEQLEKNIEIVKEMLDFMGLPVILTYRPIWSNKPVGEKTIGFDTLLPTGETLLVGSAYSQMQVFSRPFKVQFRNKNNQLDYTYQTSLGFSSRMIFTSLLLSSDERGLNILPEIAPKQIIIIPIYKKDNYDEIATYADNVRKNLIELGFRAEIDFSDKSVGEKHYLNEAKGVPIRIEIGKNELKENAVILISRETNARKKISITDISVHVENMLNESTKSIKERVKKVHSINIIKDILNEEDVIKVIDKGNVASYSLCFDPLCSKKIESNCKGEVIGYSMNKNEKGKSCISCGKSTVYTAFHARHL